MAGGLPGRADVIDPAADTGWHATVGLYRFVTGPVYSKVADLLERPSMTDYAWFPVTGNGETPQTAYTWNIGTYAFNTGTDWVNVDANPPYPITTGTVPGAVAGGVAQDSIYIFAGGAPGSVVADFYTADPADGDPYVAAASDGNYDLATDVLLNAGSVEVASLGMDAVNVQGTTFYPKLDIEGATLHVTGTLVGQIPTTDYPAGIGTALAYAQQYALELELFYGIRVAFTNGGTIDIGSGGKLELGGSIDTGYVLAFNGGNGNVLQLDGVTPAASVGGTIAVGGTITGFAAGDTIDLPNIARGIVNSISYNATTHILDINVGDPTDILLDVTGPALGSNSFTAGTDSGGGLDLVTCYAAGTRIATPDGEQPIESLAVGGLVHTVLSGPRPVIWIGRRHIALGRHPAPDRVRPIRIAAGAFGSGLPRRDLLLSPDHAVYVDGALIPIRTLVNGTSIAPAAGSTVTYYHIELAQHDVLLAEGLPAESYLEAQTRDSFDNGGRVMRAHADFASRVWEAAGCAPLLVCGPVLDAVRARLAAHAWAAAA
jgi:hypothetical protein